MKCMCLDTCKIFILPEENNNHTLNLDIDVFLAGER